MTTSVSVIGLGKLGACLAAVLADKGFDVWGYDVKETTMTKLRAKEAPVEETELSDLIKRVDRLTPAMSIEQAVLKSSMTFIVVPTPSTTTGEFSNFAVLEAIEEIGKAIRLKPDRHTVVITSTVMPGSTNGVIREKLEAAAGRAIGPQLGLAYSPEFIALGSVIHDMLHPDMILIGEADLHSGEELSAVMRRVVGDSVPFHVMNPTEAEITKISLNAYVTMKLSYANTLGEICSGLDVRPDVIADAIGSDSRIGKKYLRPGGPYGGPCFCRDSQAFIRFASITGGANPANLAFATDAVNKRQFQKWFDSVLLNTRGGENIGIIGLAYKLNTNVTENSLGTDLMDRLLARGFTVITYDPLVPCTEQSAQECVNKSNIVVLTQPFDFIRDLNLDGKRVIDPWRTRTDKNPYFLLAGFHG